MCGWHDKFFFSFTTFVSYNVSLLDVILFGFCCFIFQLKCKVGVAWVWFFEKYLCKWIICVFFFLLPQNKWQWRVINMFWKFYFNITQKIGIWMLKSNIQYQSRKWKRIIGTVTHTLLHNDELSNGYKDRFCCHCCYLLLLDILLISIYL